MASSAMCYQDSGVHYIVKDSIVDCTIQERKSKGLEMYFEVRTATDDAEPSYIMVLFPILPL